jgi:predicted DNA-binding transcriptional regulator YafY
MSAELLRKAIDDRAVISFHHEGSKYSVEPHSLGYNQALTLSAGPLLLRAWCITSKSWRDFQVKHMSRIEIGTEHFSGDRPGHLDLMWVIRDISGRSGGSD